MIAAERRAYHADDVGANARSILEALRLQSERAAAAAQNAARSAIEAEGVRHTRAFSAGIRAQAQIDVSALLRDDDLVNLLSIRSEEANRLITNLSQDVHDRIERETLGAIAQGRSNADIAKSLQQIEGISRNRARLIARDQASKLNGDMNQFRQEQAGVTHYKWKTILDGRERDTHHANNGRVFAWAEPSPITGHPGHDINCRCRALAILSEEPEEIDKSAVPPEAKTEDLADFFVKHLPAIRSVASVPTSNLGATPAADISARLEQAYGLQAAITEAAKLFTEKTAEQLVVELYGFLPKEADLEALAPARFSKLFAPRRSVLINAARDRLEMITRQLRQAQIRPK